MVNCLTDNGSWLLSIRVLGIVLCFCLYEFWGLFCMFLSIWVLRIVLCFCLYEFWGLFCMFLSIWVLRIVLCVFVSMGSEDCFVCVCLYGFWGLFCMFLSLWVLRIVLYVFDVDTDMARTILQWVKNCLKWMTC